MAAVMDIVDCSWESQDLDLGLVVEVEEEKPTVLIAPSQVEEHKDVVIVDNTPIKISPIAFISGILTKSHKTYLSEKKLKSWEKSIRAIDLNRDKNISRNDAIRMILEGRAILINASIDWKSAISGRFTEDSPILRDITKWKITTDKEKWEIEDKDLYRSFGINVEYTKKQACKRR
jgi:hypothetical protein